MAPRKEAAVDANVLRRALSFLDHLEAKLEKAKTVLEEQKYRDIDRVRGELRTYASYVKSRCGACLGEQCDILVQDIDSLLPNFTCEEIRSDSERRTQLLVQINSLLGATKASHELVQSLRDRPLRRVISGAVAAAGLIPVVLGAPELLSFIAITALGYFGLSGIGADFLMRFRGAKRNHGGEDFDKDIIET